MSKGARTFQTFALGRSHLDQWLLCFKRDSYRGPWISGRRSTERSLGLQICGLLGHLLARVDSLDRHCDVAFETWFTANILKGASVLDVAGAKMPLLEAQNVALV